MSLNRLGVDFCPPGLIAERGWGIAETDTGQVRGEIWRKAAMDRRSGWVRCFGRGWRSRTCSAARAQEYHK
jgi:hypothetical protein